MALYLIAKNIKWASEPIADVWTRFMLDTKSYSEYKRELAIVEDQYGNVLYQHIFNKYMIHPNGYKAGNRKETISSWLGKNKVKGTLLKWGKKLDEVLEKIEKDHSVKAIDNNV